MNFRNMIPNLLILTGTDTFRLQTRLQALKKKFQEKYSEAEMQTIENSDSIQTLESLILTPNLFGGKRLIITPMNFWSAENFEISEKLNFWKKLATVSDFSTLIIIEPKMDKRLKSSKFFLDQENGKKEIFDELDELGLKKWIQEYAENLGGKIDHQNTIILLDRCGTDLWTLSREIEKLTVSGEPITEALINDLTLSHPQAIIWNFLESLSKKNVQQSMSYFHALLDSGTSVHEIFPMIGREIRIHAQLKNAINRKLTPQQITAETKLHPFVIQKTLPLTKNFSKEKIERMYDQLFEIDQKLKTGGIHTIGDDTSEFELAIEKLIVEMCG